MATRNHFWVIVAKGFHPFPSRTRKLSPSAPMVLHARVCGRVGRRPIKSSAQRMRCARRTQRAPRRKTGGFLRSKTVRWTRDTFPQSALKRGVADLGGVMLGFDTIGNATLIAYDGVPILATDVWIEGGAY